MSVPLLPLTSLQQLHRRGFLHRAALVACTPFLGTRLVQAAPKGVVFKENPFSLGVASGDPVSDGVVLWTRLAPHPLEDAGGMPKEAVAVHWEVARDEHFHDVIQKGTETAIPASAHSVHVEVSGLQPDRVYWYRFIAGGESSPVGRTRTAPAAGVIPASVRFAVTSCQHYEYGYFNAYDHMLQDDLRVVFHLGDYIYEYGAMDQRPRRHHGKEAVDLAGYRTRYAQYRTDPALQKVHAAFPWVVTWDDHEFHNNCAGDQPVADIDPQKYLQRRAAAYQAYYENMPLRRPQTPRGAYLDLYRSLNYGSLLQFSVLDVRQYRTHQPCGDRNQPPCPGMFDPQATMLGKEQEAWLFQRLGSSPARWNVLAQGVMMGRVDRAAGDDVKFSMDQWAGYDVSRRRLLQFLEDRKVSNPIVLTGDIHSNWVNDLQVDCDDRNASVVGTEFVGTSISSGGDGGDGEKYRTSVMADNPFVKFYNSQRGYLRCEVTPERWQTDFRVVDFVSRADSPCRTRASFVVENGHAGAKEA